MGIIFCMSNLQSQCPFKPYHTFSSKIRTFQTLFFSIKIRQINLNLHYLGIRNCLPCRKMETKSLIALVLVFVAVAAALTKNVTAQNCGCASGLCCSQYGYCGSSDEYCGQGCQQGPCTGGTTTPSTPSSVADIVTPDFFNGIINQASSDCAGKKFYSKIFNLIYLEFRFTSSCIASVFIWCSNLIIFHIRFLLHRRDKSWHLLRYHKY